MVDARRVAVIGLVGGALVIGGGRLPRLSRASFNSIPPSKLGRPHGFFLRFLDVCYKRYIYR